MFESATPVSVAELAQLLVARKKEEKRTVLFLGSRTGGFFGNQAFSNGMQRYSLRNFSKLSELEKFDECYQMLKNLADENNKKDTGGKEELEDLLASWLTEIAGREEDNYVAELVKEGFFDIIVSTSIDSLLELAFSQAGMKSSEDYAEDYKVVNMLDDIVDVESIKAGKRTMIKAFGKLEQGSSVALAGEINWDASQKLMTLLSALPDRDVLAIGYHPFWDRKAEQVLITNGELWYVNEKLPESDSLILGSLDNDKGKYVVGLYYKRFIRELYQVILENDTAFMKQVLSNAMAPVVNPLENSKRINIFISYSHKDDQKYVDALQKFLSVIVDKEAIDIWSDKRINPGEKWHKEIQEALTTTKIAILLVSINFQTSDYINKHELPLLLEAANAGEVTLLPVLLADCPILKSDALHRYQFMNRAPLGRMSRANQDALWTKVVHRVDALLFPDRQ